MKKNKTIKINPIILVVLILSFLVAVGQLIHIALFDKIDGMDIAEFAKNRNTTTKKLYASRGAIYDVNGEILAQSVNSYTVIAYLSESRTKNMNNPKHVVDKETTARKLSEVFEQNGISMSNDHILNLLNWNVYQVELGPGGRGITEYIKTEIEKLGLPGISFIQGTKRYYKNSTLAPYVVGYARENDEGKIVGEMGIEQYFNDELEGVDGSSTYETDVYGYRLPNSTSKTVEPEEGKDIYLTIDATIQRFLEEEVKKLADKYKVTWITLTVADAKTGAILGTESTPSFDLNNRDTLTNYLNPLVSYQYEPGSTMKIFSFLATMENGLYNGQETYMSGNKKVANTVIYDFNNDGWGVITYDKGFENSSNVAAMNLAEKLGREKLRDFYDKIGLGKKTGISLPGEVAGYANFNYETELATASFGQGITTTPIQTIQALTLLANDGVVLKPYIVSKIVDKTTGEVQEFGKEELGKVASKENVEYMRNLMSNVMSGITDAKFFNPKTVSMIGKTGTASIPSPNGGYISGKYDYIRSFAGLFPREDPQYIVYISAKQLVGNFKDVGQAVADIADEIANYKNIASREEEDYLPSEIVILDNYLNTLTIETEEKLKQLKLNPIIIGDGKYVVGVYPNDNSKVLTDSKVFVRTSSNNIVMPDVVNWSENEIITYCNMINLKYSITGYGKVKNQSILPGDIINLDSNLIVELG